MNIKESVNSIVDKIHIAGDDEKAVAALNTELDTVLENAVSTGDIAEATEAIVERTIANEMEKRNLAAQPTGTAAKEKAASQIAALYRAAAKNDMGAVKALSEGTDANGGFLTHPEFMKEIVRQIEEHGTMRKLCKTVTMGTDVMQGSAVLTKVTAYIVAEAAQITASNGTFSQISLIARKHAAISISSNELIDDNTTDMEIFELVAEQMGEQLAILEDLQILQGDGTGINFEGLLVNTSVNTVTMAAGKIDFNDATISDYLDVQEAVTAAVNRKSVYVMHPDVWRNVRKLVDGQGRPLSGETTNTVVTTSEGADGSAGTLWDKPVYLSESSPANSDTAVSTKFLVYGDFSKAIIGDRKQMQTTVLTEGTVAGVNLGETDQSALRGIKRTAFDIALPTSFAVLKTAAA